MDRLFSRSRLFSWALAVAAVLLTTCAQPGLGAKVDITAPKLTISSPASDGLYVAGSVALSGTATDDLGVKSVTVTYPTPTGTVTRSATLNGKTWNLNLASGSGGGADRARDGSDTVTVTVTDSSGKATTQTRLLYVDNVSPTVLVTSPGSHGVTPPAYSDYVDLKGEAWDASPIVGVNVTVFYTQGGVAKFKRLQADGTNTWSVRFLLKNAGVINLGGADDGTLLSYTVEVEDAAHNVSASYYHSQEIYAILKTMAAGKLFPTTLELGTLDQGGASPSSPTGLTTADLAAARIDNATVSERANFGFSYLSLPSIQYSNLDPAHPGANTLAPGSVIVGNVVPPANAGAVDPTTMQFKLFRSSDYPSGPVLATLTAGAPLGTQLILTNLGSSQGFKVALKDAAGIDLLPGQYVLEVIAQANGSGVADDHIAFGIDSAAPSFAETAVGNTLGLKSAAFALSGTAASLAGLDTILVEQSVDGGATFSTIAAASKTYSAGTTSDSWTTGAVLPSPAADGSYSYRLTLTSMSGLQAILYRSVLYDATAPALAVTSPSAGTWLSTASPSFSGTANDGSGTGVLKTFYAVSDDATDYTSAIATWQTAARAAVAGGSTNPAGPSGPWAAAGGLSSAWTGSASGLAEGRHRLWVVSIDKAGNPTDLALVGAGSLQTGHLYTIETLGTTDFTAVGAASNTVGLSFTATSAGSGSGQAWEGSGQLVSFGVDTAVPTLSFDGTTDAVLTAATAGYAVPTFNAATAGNLTQFGGSAGDTNALAALTVSVDGAAAQSISVTSGSWTFAYAPNPSTHDKDGVHFLTFTATDVSGRSATKVQPVTVDTRAPTTTVTSPSTGWVSAASVSATGTASDGTGTGVLAVYLKADDLYSAATSTDHSAEDPTIGANNWSLATSTTSWSDTITLVGEGRKTLWIKAVDSAGNTTTAAGAVAGRVDFGLDLLPPSLTFTDAVGSLVNAAFSFTGTATDSNPAAAATLAVSADGGAALAVTVTGGTWSYSPALPADGSHTYVFTATDVAGKTTTLSRTLTVDTAKPTVTFSQPGNYTPAQAAYWLTGATASLGGSASDSGTGASGVASVRFLLAAKGASHAADDPLSSPGWGPAGGTTNWSTTANLLTLGEGQFTLWTAAVDNAGNVALVTSRDFGVDQAAPTLSETNRAATSSSKVTFTLAGAVGDSNALESLTVTESANAGLPVTVTYTPSVTVAGAQAATYTTAALPLGGAVDGSYVYTLTATDAAGKTQLVTRTVTIDTTAPAVVLTAVPSWLRASAHTFAGTASDLAAGASGVASVQYSLDGGGWSTAIWVDGSGGANTSGTWSATVTGLAEGNHTVAARATDAAGNVTTLSSSSFGVDLAPPSLSETFLNTGSQVTKNTAFTLTGSVTDSNPASVGGTTLTVSVSVNGGAPASASVLGSTWTYLQPKIDGSYSYTITATDASGSTTVVNRLVLLDATPPAITVTTPSPGLWSTASSVSVAGTGQDGAGAGILKTYYLVDDAAADHTSDISTWNATSGAAAPVSGTAATWSTAGGLPTSWTGSVSLSGEGAKRLWVVSADSAGNSTPLAQVTAGSFYVGLSYTIASLGTTDFTLIGAASNTVGLAFTATGAGSGTGTAWSGSGLVVPLGYDVNPPTLAESAIGTTSTVVQATSPVFTGTAADSSALAGVHGVTVTVDGGSAVDIPFTVAPAWSWTYTVNTVTHAQDGTHTFVFTATDAAGKTTTVTRSVLVDTLPGSATVTTPAGSSWTGSSPLSVAGTAADPAGSGVSEVWTLVDAAGVDHSADTMVAVTTGGVWKKATGTTSWTVSWNLGAEGSKTLWTAVLDSAGNWPTAYSTVAFGYDATAPTLTLTPLGGFNVPFSITGTLADAASGAASLQIKIDAAAFAPVTVAANWTYSIAASPFAALSEGAHTVSLLASDAAGNQTIQTGSFNKDTTAPTLTYSNISAGGGSVVQDTSPALAGSLADPSGVATATYTLKVWNANQSTWNTVTTAAPLGSPASATNWAWSLDLSATGLALPDGKYQISVGSADTAGNSTTSALTTFLLSRTNPSATLLSPGLGTFQNASFPLVGTASDPNGVVQVLAKLSDVAPDFASGTTPALAALPATVATGSPGVFTTNAPHTLAVNDPVYLWATPMPVAPAGPLTAGLVYYVKTVPTSTSFTLSTTAGGAALAINTSLATNLTVASAKFGFAPAVPVTVSGATLTAANHGLSNGEVVYLQGTVLPTPATAATPYYVVNAAAGTFGLSGTSGGTAVTFSTAGTAVAAFAPAHPVRWMVPSLSTGGQPEGALTAAAQVSAGSGKTNQTSRDLTLDTTAPTVALTSPLSGTRQVGNLTLVGTSSDTGTLPSGVTGTIQYQIGKNAILGNPASWTSANVTGGAYSWSIALGVMSSYANSTSATESDTAGNPQAGTNLWKLPVYFQAVDVAGNVTQKTDYYLILDPNGNVPVVTLLQPTQNGLTYGGQQRITGTAAQPVWVHDVEVAIDPTGGSNFPSSAAAVTFSGTTVNAAAQPFSVNMAVYFVGATAPQIGGVNVNPLTPYFVVNPLTNSFQVALTAGGSPVTFSNNPAGVTASVWTPATLTSTGTSVTWYYDINAGNLYPQSGGNQTVAVQARAWNSPTAGGSRGTISGTLLAPLTMTFDSTFPKVQSIVVSPSSSAADPLARSYFSQITATGQFHVLATVLSSKGISKLEKVEASPLSGTTTLYNTANSWGSSATVTAPSNLTSGAFPFGSNYQLIITSLGSTDWQAIGAPAGAQVGTTFKPTGAGDAGGGQALASNSSGDFSYAVDLSIDSDALYSNTTGVYSFDLRATDLTSPQPQVSLQNITLNEDNYHPTSSLLSSSSLVGSSFKVQGTATDVGTGSGPIAGLQKVVVYLMRGASVLDIRTGGASTAATTVSAQDMSAGGVLTAVPYPPTESGLRSYSASIDDRSEVGVTDHNGDGFIESLLTNGNGLDWWAQLDTSLLADGPVEVHYVVWDTAGNATHYLQTGFISNFAPTITSVDLGTDLNGDASILAGEVSGGITAYAATNFAVRNGLLSFKINTASGNAPLSFSVKYNGTELNSVLTSNTLTVSDFSAIPDSAVANDRVFTILVSDSTAGGAQTATVAVHLTVQNRDSTPPSISVAPFGQRYTVPLDAANGNAYTDTGKSLAAVAAYTDNVPTVGNALQGHVEYAADNVAHTGVPAVSGQVIFRGKAADNQRIRAITATITNGSTATFDGGAGAGNEFTVATWGGSALTGLSGTGWSFAADASSEGVSQADGHALNWGFTWDSTGLSTVTASGVNVTLKAYDSIASGTATRPTTTTLQAAALVGQAIANGTGIQVGSTWTTVAGFVSGTGTVTLATTVALGSTTYVIGNVASAGSFAVDVIPYVSRIDTALSGAYKNNPSAFNRTAKGRYPVADTETVVLYGFNLNGASTAVTVGGVSTGVVVASPGAVSATLLVKGLPYVITTSGTTNFTLVGAANNNVGTSFVATGAGTGNGTATTDALHSARVTVGTTVVSGNLGVSVASVAAANNINLNSRSWNTQGNGLNNPLLTDDLAFDLWKMTNITSAGATITTAKYPTMRISPSAAQNVTFAYGFSESDFRIETNSPGTTQLWETSPSKYAWSSLAYDQATTPNFYATGIDTDRTSNGYNGNTSTKFNFFSRQIGSGAGYPGSYQSGTYKRLLESNWNGSQYDSLRSQFPDLVATSPATITDPALNVAGSPARIYLTYYDNLNSQTKFRYGTVGVSGDTIGLGLQEWVGTAHGGVAAPPYSTGFANEGTTGAPIALSPYARFASVTAGGNAYYSFSSVAGHSYLVRLYGQTTGTLAANADVYGYQSAGFGAANASSTLTGTAMETFTMAATGTTIWVRVAGVAATTYALAIQDTTHQNEGTVGTPVDTPHDTGSYGLVTNTGISYYRFSVIAGAGYQFRLDNVSAGARLDVYTGADFATGQIVTNGAATPAAAFNDYQGATGYVAGATTTYLYAKVTGTAGAGVTSTYRVLFKEAGSSFGYQEIAGPNTTKKAGQYAAVGVTSTGVAVAAWYDKPNTQLYFSYNTDPAAVNGSSEAQWQTNAISLDPDFSGWSVSLDVDAADHIHVAYYNSSNGDLRYAYLATYDSAPSGPVTVDSFLSTGTNVMVKTKFASGNYVPYIVYYEGALTATKYSMRFAYRTDFTALTDGANPSTDQFTGTWEVGTVPVTNIPRDYRFSLGFKTLGSATNSPILGYGTETTLETAQLK